MDVPRDYHPEGSKIDRERLSVCACIAFWPALRLASDP